MPTTKGPLADATVRRSTAVVAQRVHDDLVLVHLDTNRIVNLTPTAARLWDLLDAHARVDALVDALLAEYDVDRELLAADVARTLRLLGDHRFVRIERGP